MADPAVATPGGGVPEVVRQLTGLSILVIPLVAIRWNLAASLRRRPGRLAPRGHQRWRLEIYGNQPGAEGAVVDRIDIPFPVKRVRSARGQLAVREPQRAWALPQMELEVDVEDPFTEDVLSGLFGVDHQVRFVTGNEAVIEAGGNRQVRVRALPFRRGLG